MLLLSALATTLSLASPAPAPAPALEPAPVHCQVPCGIYGDRMRIDAMLEDLTTVEKAMNQINELSGQEKPNYNQLVRWVTNKEDHAQKIQDQVAAYWLAQRIKAPKTADEREAYLQKLELLHHITVGAMKCKQGTDVATAAKLREKIHAFDIAYFGPEEAAHVREHHGGDHR